MNPIDCMSIPFRDFKIPSIDKNNQSIIFPDCDIPVSISPPTFPITIIGKTYEFNNNVGDLITGFLYTITINNNNIIQLFICAEINLKCVCTDLYYLNLKNNEGITISPPIRGNIPKTDLQSYIINIDISGYVYTIYIPAFINLCDTTRKYYEYLILNLKRSLRLSFRESTTGSLKLLNLITGSTNCFNCPRIDILGQTLIDGSDVGNVIFTISDRFSYYTKTPIKLNTKICILECISIEEIKITIFNKKCPKMVNIFIGEGEFLYTKVDNIWKKSNSTIDLPTFYRNIILYGMVRYILSKILYGNFNINYLLRKYYKQFLIDLGKSRFCNFLQFFLDPINSQLFKYFK